MRTVKKEVIYTMPYNTAEDIKKATRKRDSLYNRYNSVQVYPNGLHEVRIIATNP